MGEFREPTLKKLLLFTFALLVSCTTVPARAAHKLFWLDTPPLVITTGALPAPATANTKLPGKRLESLTLDKDRTLDLNTNVTKKSADKLVKGLADLDKLNHKRIYIVINSNGGAIDQGGRIENALDATKSPVTCVVDGGAYSMAAGIFLHCDEKLMTKHSDLMFHEGSMSLEGERSIVQSENAHFLKLFIEMDQDNADHLGMSLDVYQKKVANEWWLTTEEAIDAHAADGVVSNFLYVPPKDETPPPVFPFPF